MYSESTKRQGICKRYTKLHFVDLSLLRVQAAKFQIFKRRGFYHVGGTIGMTERM